MTWRTRDSVNYAHSTSRCTCCLLQACSSTLKMKAICSSETSPRVQRTSWRYIPEDRKLLKNIPRQCQHFLLVEALLREGKVSGSETGRRLGSWLDYDERKKVGQDLHSVRSDWSLKLIWVIYNNSVRASQETHYVSATEPNRLMLFEETVAVYCENHTEHTDTVRTSQETHLRYRAQPVNAVRGNNRCLVWEPYGTQIQSVPHRKHITSPLQSPIG
jgi:hypothetical protein